MIFDGFRRISVIYASNCGGNLLWRGDVSLKERGICVNLLQNVFLKKKEHFLFLKDNKYRTCAVL